MSNYITPFQCVSHSGELFTYKQFGFQSKQPGEVYFGPPQKTVPDNIQAIVKTANIISQSGVPNYQRAKIPITTTFDIALWHKYLVNYDDKQIMEYLTYGFPLCSSVTQSNSHVSNHPTAVNYPTFVNKYLQEEVKLGAILGPFDKPMGNLHCSPLLTRPKDVDSRRVIVDLSWPPDDCVNKNVTHEYDNVPFDLTLPNIDNITDRIKQVGSKAILFKVDIKRAT